MIARPRLVMLAVALGVVLAAPPACHRHVRSTPGVIDVATPPSTIAAEQVETPRDPGERMIVLTPGVVAGGLGRTDGLAGGELELEVGVHLGNARVSHNDHSMPDRLFLPRGLLAPDSAVGLIFGWSALRMLQDDAENSTTTTGPLHARAQIMAHAFGAGAGWRWDPRTGETGPEVSLWAVFYELRMHVTTDGELEALLGVHLKWPVTWVWGR